MGMVSNKILGRFYVQPQWIFDSINRRERCGEADYALGETLPPHLSPFLAERRIGDYVPPEQRVLEEGEKEGEKEEDDEDDEDDDEEEIENDSDSEEEDKKSDVKEEDTSMGVK